MTSLIFPEFIIYTVTKTCLLRCAKKDGGAACGASEDLSCPALPNFFVVCAQASPDAILPNLYHVFMYNPINPLG